MNRFYKKLGIIFVMAFAIMLGSFTNVLAADGETQTIKINNKTLTFNHVYYVNAIEGNDTNNGTSKQSAFKTVTKAYNSCIDGDAIYLIGIENANYNDYTSAITKQISIIGDGLLSKIEMQKGFLYLWAHSTKEVNLYRLNIIADRVFQESNSISRNFYNCAFKNINFIGFSAGREQYKFYNCTLTSTSYDDANYYNCYCHKSIYNNDYGYPVFNKCLIHEKFMEQGQIRYNGDNTVTLDENYNILGIEWKNLGDGFNPNGSQSNIGVYGGEFAWGKWDNTTPSIGTVLNIEPEKNKIHLNETVAANLTIDNIKDIAAEDVRIKYDNTKLQFLGIDEVEGMKLVVSDNKKAGELRFIVASKGEKNIINAKKILLRLKFKGIAAGEALVDITKGRVSDGIEIEKDLTDEQCGQATIIIDESVLKDVNNSGEFTLLDLAIDARHMGKDPKSAELAKYNTDIVPNNAIDDADLLEIGKLMLENPNYKF